MSFAMKPHTWIPFMLIAAVTLFGVTLSSTSQGGSIITVDRGSPQPVGTIYTVDIEFGATCTDSQGGSFGGGITTYNSNIPDSITIICDLNGTQQSITLEWINPTQPPPPSGTATAVPTSPPDFDCIVTGTVGGEDVTIRSRPITTSAEVGTLPGGSVYTLQVFSAAPGPQGDLWWEIESGWIASWVVTETGSGCPRSGGPPPTATATVTTNPEISANCPQYVNLWNNLDPDSQVIYNDAANVCAALADLELAQVGISARNLNVLFSENGCRPEILPELTEILNRLLDEGYPVLYENIIDLLVTEIEEQQSCQLGEQLVGDRSIPMEVISNLSGDPEVLISTVMIVCDQDVSEERINTVQGLFEGQPAQLVFDTLAENNACNLIEQVSYIGVMRDNQRELFDELVDADACNQTSVEAMNGVLSAVLSRRDVDSLINLLENSDSQICDYTNWTAQSGEIGLYTFVDDEPGDATLLSSALNGCNFTEDLGLTADNIVNLLVLNHRNLLEQVNPDWRTFISDATNPCDVVGTYITSGRLEGNPAPFIPLVMFRDNEPYEDVTPIAVFTARSGEETLGIAQLSQGDNIDTIGEFLEQDQLLIGTVSENARIDYPTVVEDTIYYLIIDGDAVSLAALDVSEFDDDSENENVSPTLVLDASELRPNYQIVPSKIIIFEDFASRQAALILENTTNPSLNGLYTVNISVGADPNPQLIQEGARSVDLSGENTQFFVYELTEDGETQIAYTPLDQTLALTYPKFIPNTEGCRSPAFEVGTTSLYMLCPDDENVIQIYDVLSGVVEVSTSNLEIDAALRANVEDFTLVPGPASPYLAISDGERIFFTGIAPDEIQSADETGDVVELTIYAEIVGRDGISLDHVDWQTSINNVSQ